MKKYMALLLCGVLLVGLTACGKTEDKGSSDTTQSTVTTTTVGQGSTTTGGVATVTTTGGTKAPATTGKSTTAATTTTTTVVYVPSGATVPIGTRPTTTVTTTAATTAPTGGNGTTMTTVTTTTTATKPTATKPTVEQPYIILPAVGSDIDVTKQKNRIRVSDAAAWCNDDGTIGVALTFRNYTSNWITEETDYVMYTCYDKDGKVVQKATKLMIGVIDTKKHPVKTYYFDVPADTAEVRLVKSKIVYWTEWG